MIELVGTPEELKRLCQKDPVGTQILSEFALFGHCGHSPDLPYHLWRQGEHLALALRNGVLRLCGEPEDLQELREFLLALRPSAVFCREELGQALLLSPTETGKILTRTVSSWGAELTPDFTTEPVELAELFARCGMKFQRESFLPEAARALRTGRGAACTARENGRLIGAAFAWQITEREAVIGAVAVAEPYRRKDVGKRLVEELAEKLSPRTLYVFREEQKNREFYESCGFRPLCGWMAGQVTNESMSGE